MFNVYVGDFDTGRFLEVVAKGYQAAYARTDTVHKSKLLATVVPTEVQGVQNADEEASALTLVLQNFNKVSPAIVLLRAQEINKRFSLLLAEKNGKIGSLEEEIARLKGTVQQLRLQQQIGASKCCQLMIVTLLR